MCAKVKSINNFKLSDYGQYFLESMLIGL
ncbi:hypothetical protein CECT5772_09787 [Streptococcus equi subsp. ruminatorum CECT 5772]|uniref:Uncharacterized protein n=1 Tax=Streptococcus equi subsp. ruminatorum CECT 5772 TaxID=1051981 RepID=A0A922NTB8_9STRE|nr:hypothetical protein CECT5772_09787 [Streptococcus equi subsp. ruminatorum CECT 5772]